MRPTQTVPFFPTASKHSTHRDACNSIIFIRLLTVPITPGGGGQVVDPLPKPTAASPSACTKPFRRNVYKK